MRFGLGIRSCSSPRLRSVAKTSGARYGNCSRQCEKTCGRGRYSRQTLALCLTPVSSSSTTRALNSGVNARRFAILFPPLDRFCLNYRICPVLGLWRSFGDGGRAVAGPAEWSGECITVFARVGGLPMVVSIEAKQRYQPGARQSGDDIGMRLRDAGEEGFALVSTLVSPHSGHGVGATRSWLGRTSDA